MSATQGETPRLEVRGLSKRYGPVLANDDISLAVAPAELHCLLGENGAGKSTLSACIYGLAVSDMGEILVDGQRLDLRSPADAIAAGIGMVHQHFVLVPRFTVLENIVVGTGSGLRLDLAAARGRITDLCARLHLDIDLDRRVDSLSVGEMQWVEIVKSLYLGARLLILDEPTAVLTPQESERLFALIAELKGSGIAIILITHKMNEVMRSDRVSVLRKGRLVATLTTADTTRDALTELMVGRSVATIEARHIAASQGASLSVRGLTLSAPRGSLIQAIDLDVAPGEILGIAGVAGNGQDELLETIAGIRAPRAGTITLRGEPMSSLGAAEVAGRGVGHVPSDRFRDGLARDFTIAENLILGQQWLRRWRKGPLLDRAAMAANGQDAIARYAIATTGPEQPSGRLSGGNAQKVIIAREFAKAQHLLLLNQPTRGVDVGAIEFIHAEVLAKRDQGCAVILVSEELDDLFALSDRIIVMFRNEVMGEVRRGAFDKTAIGRLMAGARAA
ncbi:ABC transporter ATP-binding protein [Aestuariivirga litoralis]|uniref:ABC transporter ATP-binding protein n=1 Tax=Aestuariivirga litoralis TaxID=2650924 RepID=A0A2W2BMT0_9HYPH|nr:ABC transporter ATP-binding protein [Aestuariivirga litoralis]PZF77549.1 ABC transporter ATP-binding protein [Aestuariivirga litoralis]